MANAAMIKNQSSKRSFNMLKGGMKWAMIMVIPTIAVKTKGTSLRILSPKD
jgi:hypothetical protein